MQYLYPDFLKDQARYAEAAAFWRRDIWERTPKSYRSHEGWRPEWFNPSPPHDGNPIFTAISKQLRKAVRVIQYEPLSLESDDLEFDFWLDTFGGEPTDPRAIRELVISCSLSVESAALAQELISAWLIGSIKITNPSKRPQGFSVVRRQGRQSWTETVSLRPERDLEPAA